MVISSKTDGVVGKIKIFGSINKFDIKDLESELDLFQNSSLVLIDLGNVEFIDSGFLNMLVRLKKKGCKANKNYRLLNPNDFVMEILRISHISQIIDIECSEPSPA